MNEVHALESEDRGFLTWIATMVRQPLPELWDRLSAGSALTADGRQIVRLDLSPLGSALRDRWGPTRPLALPLGGLDALRELDCTGLGLDHLDLRPLRDLRVLRCARNRLRTLDLAAHPGLAIVDCAENPLSEVDVRSLAALEFVDAGAAVVRAHPHQRGALRPDQPHTVDG